MQNVRELWELLEAGRLKPVVGQVFALEHGVKAFETLEGREARGKVVIKVSD
jgi:alcohol dehydrogenase